MTFGLQEEGRTGTATWVQTGKVLLQIHSVQTSVETLQVTGVYTQPLGDHNCQFYKPEEYTV